MLLCRIVAPTKLCFALHQASKNLIGLINHAHHTYRACMQHTLIPKQNFDSLVTNARITEPRYSKVPAAGITTSQRLCVKLFVEAENEFAYNVMETHASYSHTLSMPKCAERTSHNQKIDLLAYSNLLAKDWRCESPSDICRAFKEISYYVEHKNVCISEEVFNGLCNSIALNASAFDDSQLVEILSSLNLWPSTLSLNSNNFHCIWTALDVECEARVAQWDVDSLLYFADHWYKLHLGGVSKYMEKCVTKLGCNSKNLSPPQIVQSMFYVNVRRNAKPDDMDGFEQRIKSFVDELSLDELAIVAMAFFKSRNQIQCPILLGCMMERTVNEIATINEISLSALLKIFRYSKPFELHDRFYNLLDKLFENRPIHSLSLMCCIHITLSGTYAQICHEELLKVLFGHFANNISALRIKDLERIAFTLSMFNYNVNTMPFIFKELLNELQNPHRDKEFKQYPESLLRCVYHLAVTSVYSNELSKEVLGKQFKDKYGDVIKGIGFELLSFDTMVGIECPTYDGNRISPELRGTLARKYLEKPLKGKTNLSRSQRIVIEIAEVLSNYVLGGSGYIYYGNVLPSVYRSDIVFGLTHQGSAIKIPSEFQTKQLGEVKHPPSIDGSVQWHCVVFASINNYTRGTKTQVGLLDSKLRQLKILGYIPVLIPWYEWPTKKSMQKTYIMNKIGLKFQTDCRN